MFNMGVTDPQEVLQTHHSSGHRMTGIQIEISALLSLNQGIRVNSHYQFGGSSPT